MEKQLQCPVYKKCGGCSLLHDSYQKQLEEKQQNLIKLLKEFGRLEPIIGMENPYHYRNKVHAVFDRDKKGSIISGVYEANTHRVVSVDSCLIEDEKADEIIRTIRTLAKSFRILTYDEDKRTGLLRHVLVKRAFATGEVMVVLVLASTLFPSKNHFIKALRKEHPEITTVVLNVNNRKTSVVLGEEEKTLYGKGYIEDRLCGCIFKISSKSFYQVNPVQTELLYGKAMEFAGLTGKEIVIDAYCGIGTIGIITAKKAGRIIGIEVNPQAVKDAIENAKRNEMDNIYFYKGDAGEYMRRMSKTGEKADVLFMDPPRAGSDEVFLSSAVSLGIKQIVYISCNPVTLQRDLRYLVKKGYQVERMQGVDMFPHTGHVETVCLLSL